MEKNQVKRKRMFYLYIAFLAALSVSVALMPLALQISEKTMTVTYMSGTLFWVGLAGTIAMAIWISYSRRKSKAFCRACRNRRRLGLIHFFQNMPAFICDILMFVSLLGFVITRIFTKTGICPFIFLSVLIFSFGMHCMLNGSNYTYINYKFRRVIES